MNSPIEALYIYDELNNPILEHSYRGRPLPAHSLLSLFLAHPAPRPSLLYLSECSPPISVFSVVHANLLFLVPSSHDVEPLLVLEFLHRVIDVLEEFVGAPLLPSKVQANYEVVAQLLNEMCDAGVVCCTEPNALAETVQRAGWIDRLLSGVGLPGSSPSLTPSVTHKPPANAPAIPWRRSNVRHTSNELYVDIVESLNVTLAPSGRVLSALVAGTIVFTAKVSGVPDLLLLLSAPGGAHSLAHKIELPVFHPCVRLARWRENPGELSFVPPDGRFVLTGYEVDLLPAGTGTEDDAPPSHMEKLFLPATVDLQKNLGANGNEFEVRLTLNTNFPGTNSRSGNGPRSGTSTPSFLGGGSSGSSNAPVLDEVVVHVPVPRAVRNITDIRPSRGEAHFLPGSDSLEWRVPTKTKDAGSISGTATLRCTVVGPPGTENESADEEDEPTRTNPLLSYYDESLAPADTSTSAPAKATATTSHDEHPSLLGKSARKTSPHAPLMPTSVSVSFAVQGWLPSGIRVDKLLLDPRRSRGLGEGVKPYKWVKYLCVSKRGVERRC